MDAVNPGTAFNLAAELSTALAEEWEYTLSATHCIAGKAVAAHCIASDYALHCN